MSPSYTRDYPLVIARGAGAVVEDVDGNVFLDCAAGIAVNSTGHSHPDVVKAITEQAQRFLHMSGTDFYYEPQVRLAEELAAIAPIDGGVRVVLRQLRHRSDRGVHQAGALRTRRAEHHRVSRRRSTAGRGLAVADGEQGDPAARLRPADAGRLSTRRTPTAIAVRSGSTPETLRRRVPRLSSRTRCFVHLVSPDEVAAIVVEPIQGEGGYVVAPDAVPAAAARADHASTASCWSSTKCSRAWGAPGKMFAIEHTGVEPDIVAIAKGIASGLPLGVAAARAELMTWPPGAHASTFGGNPVSCAAALATIKLLQDSADGERRGRRRASDGRARRR